MLKKWLREPLLHFLLIGAMLFFAYSFQNNEQADPNINRIVISQATVDSLIKNWEKKWQRPPIEDELNGLIEEAVREQVLYKEALALGLDRNDPVVRRRMAQKIKFISSDIVAQIEPGEEQLEAYLAANPERFELPAYISFVQIYLSADRRGTSLKEDARIMLLDIEQSAAEIDTSTMGDPFMFGQVYDNLSDFEVARVFGRKFTDAIFKLPVDKWQGPVHSGLGYHLVRIESSTPSQQARLSDVRDKVRFEWTAEQRRNMDQALYHGLRQKYQITLPGESTQP